MSCVEVLFTDSRTVSSLWRSLYSSQTILTHNTNKFTLLSVVMLQSDTFKSVFSIQVQVHYSCLSPEIFVWPLLFKPWSVRRGGGIDLILIGP